VLIPGNDKLLTVLCNDGLKLAEFRAKETAGFGKLNRFEPELCVTLRLFYVNVSRLVTFTTEEEKAKATETKNFWHAMRMLKARS
jgi:hypothetical protein